MEKQIQSNVNFKGGVAQLKSRYKALFDNQLFGLLVLRNRSLNIVSANEVACEIIGTDNLDSRPILEFVFEADHGRVRDILAKDNTPFEFRVKKSNGSVHFIRAQRCFDNGQTIEILLFDVTEERKARREIRKVNYYLDQFIYRASHDFRSPLTSLQGLLNLARAEIRSSNAIERYISMMEETVMNMSGLLVGLASVNFSSKKISLENFAFEREISLILEECKSLNPVVTLYVDIRQSSDFFTDPTGARIILKNLITNAIKFCDQASESPFVKISVTTNSDIALIDIQDNGVGIETTLKAKIFKLFFRASNQAPGIGLGLFAVKKIVDKLRGSVKVESVVKEGSTFRVELPNLKYQRQVAESISTKEILV